MNKLLIALIAGVFATVAAAQTAPAKPTVKEKQQDVSATTQAGSTSSTGATTAKEAAANTAKSKETAKMTTAEKNKAIKEVNKEPVNPNNSASTAATAKEQAANTAKSKELPKQNTELKTKEGQKELAKELQQKSKNQ